VEATLARLGASLDFAEAAQVLRYATGVVVSEATARRRTYAAGAAALAVDAAERTRIEQTLPEAPVAPAVLQLSIDATKVSVLKGGWTDMKLATFAEVVPGVDVEGQPDVKAVNLSYVARWEPAEGFATTLTTEAHRRGVPRAGQIASPNDGADWIQGVLDLVAPNAERILDEPHGAEHLGTIGELVFGAGRAEATAWTSAQRDRLKADRDGPAVVLAELARCRDRGPVPGAPARADGLSPTETLVREVAYFEKRADQIRYAAFRQAGYPIGSGIAESGHKVVIGARMKHAGQHWAPAHLNPMGALRSLVASDRWEASWPAIWAQQRTTTAAQRQARRRRCRAAPVPAPTPAAPAAMARPAPPPAAAVVPPPTAPAPPPATAPRPRRPAPDHPWRRRCLTPRQRLTI